MNFPDELYGIDKNSRLLKVIRERMADFINRRIGYPAEAAEYLADVYVCQILNNPEVAMALGFLNPDYERTNDGEGKETDEKIGRFIRRQP